MSDIRTVEPYEHPQTLIPRLARAYGGEFAAILDIGGGGGTVGVPNWGSAAISVLDIFPPRTAPPNLTIGSALDAVEIYGEKSFDLVLCCDMIEHLEKADGPALFKVAEAIARRLVIMTTPYGFSFQDPAAHPEEPWANNPNQKHLSGWFPEEFIERGYEIVLNGGDHGYIVALKDMRA